MVVRRQRVKLSCTCIEQIIFHHVARMGEGRGVYRVLVGKHEGKRPFGRSRLRWGENIKMDLQEVGFGGMDWIGLKIGTGGGHL